MIDLHFDLLTKLYISYVENDFEYIESFIKNYNKNNVTGVIANMCFESIEEMKEEYSKHYFNENVSVVEMFQVVKCLLDEYLDKDIDVMPSIEGCDYIDWEDLDILKDLGLKATLPVWNNQNKYGSGNRSNSGLTVEGVKFIWHAFELGLGVDLSHANKKTFDDIIEVAKIAKSCELNPVVYASHSNVYELCKRDRNLTDKQLLKIKELDGVVGLFSHRNFILKDAIKNNVDDNTVKMQYLNHIKHLENLFGSIENIALSTDDMTFCADKDDYYELCPIFNYKTIKQDTVNLLRTEYNDQEIYQLLEGNALNLFNRIDKNIKEATRWQKKKK